MDDIQQLKQALADSEASRRGLLDSSLDCIICTDEQERVTEFNNAAERVFRIARRTALGKDLTELILPAGTRERHRKQMFAAFSSPGVELVGNRVETKALRSDGSEFPAEFTVARIFINQQANFVVHVRDITARKKAEEAVVWMAAIVESSQDAIISKDLSGRILSWNQGAETMYGYTPAEAIGQNISLLAPPESPDEIPMLLKKLARAQKIKNFETVRIAKNGKRLKVLLTISPVGDAEGNVCGASVLARDITTEKLAQEALRRATETSVYGSPVPIVAADVQGRVTTWNPAAAATFGWSEGEVMGQPVPYIPAEEAEAAGALHRRLLAGEILTGIEVRRQRKDGSCLTISMSASPLWDEKHLVKGIIGFLTDITDHKNVEEAWRRAEEKYRSIFENAVEGMYQATPDGKYLSANPALARMFGFDSPQELIAARDDISHQEYTHPELRAGLIQSLEKHGVVHNFEYEAQRRDGKKSWLSASARAVRDGDGRLLYLEGSVQDISERRELEHQLRQMQKIEAIGRLAGGVAHDFNNILMAISSYTELLNRKTSEEAPRRYLSEIAKAVNRGSMLTQGLLTFSRKQVSSPKVISLNTLIAQQLEMLRRLIPENVELQFNSRTDGGSVKADPSQVEQVVMNLVINARDAMPNGGRVVVTTEPAMLAPSEQGRDGNGESQKYVLLTVSDNGCGMDAETQSHIFEPFFTTKEPGKGTGLGLATVFGIVKQSMGHIAVESEAGRGTTFKIYFPQAEKRPEPVQAEQQAESVQGSETILLVEDEQQVRESTAMYLTENGYSVLQAASGPEALGMVDQHRGPIDLLVTDLVMPEMSGRELSEKLAAIHPETKIVFMSGYTRNVLANPQSLDPQWVLLQKPFPLETLGQCIRRTLNRTSAAGSGR